MKTTTIIIAAVLLGGGLYLYSKHEAAQGPTLEDQANKALASETNPYVLKALAQKVRAAGFGSLADLLDAKATGLLAFGPATTKTESVEVHPAAMISMLGAGVATSQIASSQAVALHQAATGLTGLSGGGLDPNTGDQSGPGVHAPRYLSP